MIGATDATLPSFTADALLVLLVAVNAFVGWRTGTLRRLLSLAGLYAGFLAAWYTGNSFASLFRKGDIFANAWAFVAVATAVVLVFEVLGHLFAERLERVATLAFDRVIGVFAGAAVGFFQVLVLFTIALAVGAAKPGPGNTVPQSRDQAANAVRAGVLSGQAVRAEPVVRDAFAPVVGSDLTGHLEVATQVSTVHL